MLCIIVCLILCTCNRQLQRSGCYLQGLTRPLAPLADVPTGEAGYYMLVNDTPGDILTRLPTNALDVNIGRICIAMTSICSYPLLQCVTTPHFAAAPPLPPLTRALHHLFCYLRLVSRTVVEDLLFRGRPKSRVRMLCEVAAFMIPTLAISLAVPHIKVRSSSSSSSSSQASTSDMG